MREAEGALFSDVVNKARQAMQAQLLVAQLSVGVSRKAR